MDDHEQPNSNPIAEAFSDTTYTFPRVDNLDEERKVGMLNTMLDVITKVLADELRDPILTPMAEVYRVAKENQQFAWLKISDDNHKAYNEILDKIGYSNDWQKRFDNFFQYFPSVYYEGEDQDPILFVCAVIEQYSNPKIKNNYQTSVSENFFGSKQFQLQYGFITAVLLNTNILTHFKDVQSLVVRLVGVMSTFTDFYMLQQDIMSYKVLNNRLQIVAKIIKRRAEMRIDRVNSYFKKEEVISETLPDFRSYYFHSPDHKVWN